MTFGLQCDEATSVRHPRPGRRGRHHLHRHGRRLPAGRRPPHGRADRGDRRELAARQAGQLRRGDQVLRAHRAGALGAGQFAQAHSGGRRGLAAPARHRLHRPLPAARPRPGHADRRDAGRPRRPGPRRQGPLRRLLQFLAYQVARALGRSEARGLVRFDSVQPRYNLLFRQIERELLPLCAEEGMGVIPYNPIAGGLLSGKHNRRRRRPRAPGSPWATRPATTRTATGTTGSSPRSRSCARSPNVKASPSSPCRWPGSWPTRR